MPSHIAIVGAGYAGRLCATRLARAGHRVSLIDPSPVRVQRVALHLHAVHGTRVTAALAPPLERLGVRMLADRAVGVDGSTVHLARGGRLTADRVVLALGSRTRRPPGEGAFDVGDLPAAQRLRARLSELRGGTVAIVGMGLTGLELASSLALARPELRVQLVGPHLDRGLDARSERAVRRRLKRLGVELLERVHVRTTQADALITDQGRLPADVVVWCGGLEARPLAADSGLQTDARHRAWVDATLHAGNGVYVVGDAAAVRGRPELGMSCAVAMPMGAHAARAIDADLRGEPVPEFSFAYVARCIQLGGWHAVAVRTDPLGRPLAPVRGVLAGLFKQALYRYILDVPWLEQRVSLPLYTWPTPSEA